MYRSLTDAAHLKEVTACWAANLHGDGPSRRRLPRADKRQTSNQPGWLDPCAVRHPSLLLFCFSNTMFNRMLSFSLLERLLRASFARPPTAARGPIAQRGHAHVHAAQAERPPASARSRRLPFARARGARAPWPTPQPSAVLCEILFGGCAASRKRRLRTTAPDARKFCTSTYASKPAAQESRGA